MVTEYENYRLVQREGRNDQVVSTHPYDEQEYFSAIIYREENKTVIIRKGKYIDSLPTTDFEKIVSTLKVLNKSLKPKLSHL